jgi:hypothetical protein
MFDNGSERVRVPLLSLVAASNELPESEELDALYDRFLIRQATCMHVCMHATHSSRDPLGRKGVMHLRSAGRLCGRCPCKVGLHCPTSRCYTQILTAPVVLGCPQAHQTCYMPSAPRPQAMQQAASPCSPVEMQQVGRQRGWLRMQAQLPAAACS